MKYYDRDGNPLSPSEWRETFDNRRVGKERANDLLVSTVWLGFDHNFGDGPPLIFETMVFDANDESVYEARYSTELEAIRGHLDAVTRIRLLGGWVSR